MTDPNWKPHPGKPAMTRDGKALVTDLVRHKQWGLWSEWLIRAWNAKGHALGGEPFRDLIEPTAAILAAHGIDADGNPVAKVEEVTPYPVGEVVGACVCGSWPGGECLRCPRIPAPSTRVDDRWFEAAKGFTGAIIIREGTKLKSGVDPSFDTDRAARYADALMAEVAKREGR